jgi:hypothetical protein
VTNICTFCGAVVVVVAVVSVVDVGRRSRFVFKSRHSDLSGKGNEGVRKWRRGNEIYK